MTLASDQDKAPGTLSHTAKQMLSLQEAVFAAWMRRVRTEVQQANSLAEPILVNTLPTLYDNLVQAISDQHSRDGVGVAVTTVGAEHGGERARLTNYDIAAVIAEYQHFRWTIFDVLKQNDVAITEDQTRIINEAIDATIRDAVTAFSLTQSIFRERFVAAVAHDLRTPLGAISLTSELIRLSTEPKHMHELAGQTLSHVARMDGMLNDVLDAVAFQNGARLSLRLTEFDIWDVIHEACAPNLVGSRPVHREGISVRGWWDRDSMKRALENLVGNAIKYGDANRPITIRTVASHQRMILTVHNEGDPIPPDQIESVFQVFQRTKLAKEGNKRGWGLGLPYVRGVAESHGGSIGVDSGDDRGTTFTIDIPIDSRPFQTAPVLPERLD